MRRRAVMNMNFGLTRWLTEQTRPSRWRQASKDCKKQDGHCRVCRIKKNLEAHDVGPYHLYERPYAISYDEWRNNMVTLCRIAGLGCHIQHGHCGDPNGLMYNYRIREIVFAVECRLDGCVS